MGEKWSLKRTVQCAKCPWKKSTNPHDIPNGYDAQKHERLANTIAVGDGSDWHKINYPLRIMACHEEHTSHCIGWLMNQIGPGNNIALRMALMDCANLKDVQLGGEQHQTFKDTLPLKRILE